MTTRCAVPNCNSCSEAGNGITWHSFPRDGDLLQKWICSIPRSDWLPTKWSKLCSVHFEDDCFTTDNQDSNKYRKKAPVQKRRLKKGSVPTIFPGCPSYLTKSKTVHRSDKCSSEWRDQNEVKRQDESNNNFPKADKINGFSELCIQLQRETFPIETYVIQRKVNGSVSGIRTRKNCLFKETSLANRDLHGNYWPMQVPS